MNWKFNCHKCGHSYSLAHRSIPKEKWLSGKKEGRPILECINCPSYRPVKLVGELVGNRK